MVERFSLELLLVKVFEHITLVTLLLYSSNCNPLPLFVGVDNINIGFAEDKLELALEFGSEMTIHGIILIDHLLFFNVTFLSLSNNNMT